MNRLTLVPKKPPEQTMEAQIEALQAIAEPFMDAAQRIADIQLACRHMADAAVASQRNAGVVTRADQCLDMVRKAAQSYAANEGNLEALGVLNEAIKELVECFK